MKQQSRKRTDTSRAVRPHLETLEAREVPALIGGLDPSFGSGGKVLVPTGPYTAIAEQLDGKYVVVGSNSGDFLIVRFNSNGSVDTTFNATGVQKVDFALGIYHQLIHGIYSLSKPFP